MNEGERERLHSLVSAIAMAAMELEPVKREPFIVRKAAMLRRDYVVHHRSDPEAAQEADQILAHAHDLVFTLEMHGGSIGHA